MRRILLIFLALLTNNVFGQIRFHVPFEFNSYEISDTMRKYIEKQILPIYNSTRKYEVFIKGHTDSIGSKSYNQWLSDRRANEVALLLSSKGLIIKQEVGFNYSKPLFENNLEESRAKNRRVEVEIIPKDKNILSVNSQEYKFIAEEGGTFTFTRSGSVIRIPDHAIIRKDGSKVEGEVTLTYEEYRDAADFISSGISLRYDSSGSHNYFNSGGMFKIRAYQNGEELSLASGKKIRMAFVATDTLPGMNFYQMDQQSHHWEFQHALSTNSSHGSVRGGGGGGRPDTLDVVTSCKLKISLECAGDTLAGVNHAIDLGMKYAYSQDSIKPEMDIDLTAFQDRFMSDKYAGIYKLDDANVNDDKKFPLYFEIERKKGKKYIVIVKDKSREHSELTVFKDIMWEYDSKNNPSVKEKLFSEKWSDLKISNTLMNGSVVLELKNESKKFQLVFHPIYLKQKVLKKGREERAKLLKVDFDKELVKREQSFRDSLVELQIEANKFYQMNKCFYDYSKITMHYNERCKDLHEWFRFFNKHKDSMKKRYFSWDSTVKVMGKTAYMDQLRNYLRDLKIKSDKLKSGDEWLEETEEERVQRVKDDFEMLRQISKRTIENQKSIDPTARGVIPGMIQELYLDGFGVFNCDQIHLLGKPIFVKSIFKNKSGKVIEGRVVSLVDKNINSVLTYQPDYFAYNPKSKNVLVLFDIHDRKYVLNEEEMKKLPLENDSNVVIEIEDVTDRIKSSADLKKVMGI